jgi:spermidine/putrescine transport system permease protein
MSQIDETATPQVREPTAGRRYATRLGAVVNAPLYRGTIGVLVATRRRRMLLLTVVPVIWIALFHIGPLVQMLRISLTRAIRS